MWRTWMSVLAMGVMTSTTMAEQAPATATPTVAETSKCQLAPPPPPPEAPAGVWAGLDPDNAHRCGRPAILPKAVPQDPEPAPAQGAPFVGVRPTVDVAILLDTSNSMDGLISQAKAQLWALVQQFAQAKKNGQTPALRVALFEYGNSGLPASEGYIRQVVPLTDDLDTLSQALFALSTNGGDEYCGQVIDEALTRLDWSTEPGGYKAIFIAGNEPFTQGTMGFRVACKRAIEKGVVVNTIHCGDFAAGVEGKWQEGAGLAEGKYLNIDQDQKLVHISAPQDEIILELNVELNGTYLWYGDKMMREGWSRNQMEQDTNAFGLAAAVAVQRAATKASSGYSNRGRDLVDSYHADKGMLKDVKEEALPKELQGLSLEEREAKVGEWSAKRQEIQGKIAALSAARETYVAAERQRLAQGGGAATLGDAMVAAVREQLQANGFTVTHPPTPTPGSAPGSDPTE